MFVNNAAFSAASDTSAVIVPGTPPITQYAIDCHIKTLEFVLKTRMTVNQKNAFFRAIKRECKKMEKEDRENFLEVIELIKSMTDMDDRQREVVRRVLEQDFNESAQSTPDDPASKLFLVLYKESNRPVVKDKENVVPEQAFDSFVEYLSFLQDPDGSMRVSKKLKQNVLAALKKNFEKLDSDSQQTLSEFQFTWYMIRAAWQYAEERKKIEWRKNFKKCGIRLDKAFTFSELKKALNPDVYGQMLDDAVKMKIDSVEWSQPSKFRVW